MNAKKELQEILKNTSPIKCASIHTEIGNNSKRIFNLKLDYSNFELEKYYDSLNFEYDSGYGGQELFGTVWLKDGTWLSRREYDGSEWWIQNTCPEIPLSLTRMCGDFFNTRLLSKEESIKIFIENSLKAVENNPDFNFAPENLEEVANELFSLDNVFVSRKPVEYYFNKEGEFVEEIFTRTDRGRIEFDNEEYNLNQFSKSVKNYLEKNAVVYLYCYYGMKLDLFDGDTINKNFKTFWWRVIYKKEK